MPTYAPPQRAPSLQSSTYEGAEQRADTNAVSSEATPGHGTLGAHLNQSPRSQALLQMRQALEESPRVQAQRALQRALNPDSAEAGQTGASQASKRKKPAPLQKKANATGLPDSLKAGVESLSGLALDDVRVHYNSAKPAAVQAHAYAQGTDIHLGPGQEQHLPHEAWHVVQQKQGRVKPTLQMKGVAINDDAGLEREADVMGFRARTKDHPTLQRMPIRDYQSEDEEDEKEEKHHEDEKYERDDKHNNDEKQQVQETDSVYVDWDGVPIQFIEPGRLINVPNPDQFRRVIDRQINAQRGQLHVGLQLFQFDVPGHRYGVDTWLEYKEDKEDKAGHMRQAIVHSSTARYLRGDGLKVDDIVWDDDPSISARLGASRIAWRIVVNNEIIARINNLDEGTQLIQFEYEGYMVSARLEYREDVPDSAGRWQHARVLACDAEPLPRNSSDTDSKSGDSDVSTDYGDYNEPDDKSATESGYEGDYERATDSPRAGPHGGNDSKMNTAFAAMNAVLRGRPSNPALRKRRN
jgi:hypothetical protein